MPRIMGVDIPTNKKIKISLTYIYGIGSATALEILEKAKIDPDKRASELNDADISAIVKLLDSSYEVEGDLRRQLALSVRRLQAVNCYRGRRHKHSLPCRGQRTKTNARTRKGKKKTIGAVRDKSARNQMK
ncbi:30S ribosomal protein S13 [Lentisphaera araneosa HTCC2155]|uniref:Small ribosomal subunit protein uS13 n=1 Tax=Lentisphaera araneosa HTCC2155 TaxID=313628 RepID=A6DLN4_9BACT|nr:30S ribosomal protein S13 [Lentisphaera araneosa]EDM27489.1 30S ribosomal protein S13 [Lentisphaera araneosa HTCC2155]